MTYLLKIAFATFTGICCVISLFNSIHVYSLLTYWLVLSRAAQSRAADFSAFTAHIISCPPAAWCITLGLLVDFTRWSLLNSTLTRLGQFCELDVLAWVCGYTRTRVYGSGRAAASRVRVYPLLPVKKFPSHTISFVVTVWWKVDKVYLLN